MPVARFRSRLDVPVEELFAWHEKPGAFERLSPPWQRVEIIKRTGTIHDGDVLEMEFRAGPFGKRWIALHSDYQQDRQFRDTQVVGPFRVWVHTHRMHADNADQSILDDKVQYEIPFGPALRPIVGGVIHRELTRLFRFRHARTRTDLWRHAQYRDCPRMSVAIAGDHPLTAQLRAFLTVGGHQTVTAGGVDAVVDLRRVTSSPAQITVHVWNDRAVQLDLPVDVVGPSFRRATPTLLFSEVVAGWRREPADDSWIAEDDLIGLIYHALLRTEMSGRYIAAPDVTERLPGFPVLFRSRNAAGNLLTGRV